MKYLFEFLCLLLLLVACKPPSLKSHLKRPDPDFHLYLLVGQSNMAGRGAVEAEDTVGQPRVLMFTKDRVWKAAREPLHFDKKEVGTGLGFAFGREMAGASKKVRIGLIPAAHGGSSIDAWVKGGYHEQTKGYPYDEAIARARAAMQDGVLKGILWHQGESDSRADGTKNYLFRLEDLIQRFRTDLMAPQVPFIAGELGYYRPAYQNITDVIRQLPEQVPYTAVVSAQGLNHKGDGTHFDAASARELGKRYAAALMALQEESRKK